MDETNLQIWVFSKVVVGAVELPQLRVSHLHRVNQVVASANSHKGVYVG